MLRDIGVGGIPEPPETGEEPEDPSDCAAGSIKLESVKASGGIGTKSEKGAASKKTARSEVTRSGLR